MESSSRIGWVGVVVAVGWVLVPHGALAAPPAEDLPEVKVPALAADRPRLVFRPEGKGPWTFARVKDLLESNEQMRSILEPWLDGPAERDRSPAASALRYQLTGDEAAAERAIEQLQNRPSEQISSEYYSNGWEFALAYDWLYDHPAITPEVRAKIEGYLVANAKRALELLEDETWDLKPSMWHGRTKIANLATVVALSLETAPEAKGLREAIAPYFGDACRALRLSEGWPEGYAYWLGNRSFPFALAADCWRTATGQRSVAGVDLADMIRRTDLWHVYGMGPDTRLLLYGDVFHGVLLDYFWRAQTMDYYARITGDGHLQAFAQHAHRNLKTPYRDPWRWVAAVALDPTLAMAKGATKEDPLAGLARLPLSDLFGAGSYNMAIFRTGWGPHDTHISFKAGDVQVHHAHHDAGTFTIYKEAPLAVLSGIYAGFGSQHRQMYYVRSVAANCPLVLMPGELLETKRYYNGPFLSEGGQRVVLPGGSDVESAAFWRRESQPGHVYAAGRLVGYQWEPGEFGYVAADLTCAYNSTEFSWPGQKPKIRRAVRALVWLPRSETVLVYDRIEATSAAYPKKWLVHTMNKPEAGQTKVLKGEADNGILEARGQELTVTNGQGVMHVRPLLPEKSRWLLIGGPDYRYYVETDGDQANGFDGVNAGGGIRRAAGYFDAADWRAELEPTEPAETHEFLVAMELGTVEKRPDATACLEACSESMTVCRVGDTVVRFQNRARAQETQSSSDAAPAGGATSRPGGAETQRAGMVSERKPQREVIVELGPPQRVPVDRFEPVRP